MMTEQSVSTTLNDERISYRTPVVKRRSWGKTWQLILAALLTGLVAWMLVTNIINYRAEQQALAVAAFEEETGIRVLRVAMTSGTGMVDFQYLILDPNKSLKVHDGEEPPQLIDKASGRVIATPFHEHANREHHTGVTYHEIFMNGGGLLKHGSKITIIVGDSKLENLIVQ